MHVLSCARHVLLTEHSYASCDIVCIALFAWYQGVSTYWHPPVSELLNTNLWCSHFHFLHCVIMCHKCHMHTCTQLFFSTDLYWWWWWLWLLWLWRLLLLLLRLWLWWGFQSVNCWSALQPLFEGELATLMPIHQQEWVWSINSVLKCATHRKFNFKWNDVTVYYQNIIYVTHFFLIHNSIMQYLGDHHDRVLGIPLAQLPSLYVCIVYT